MYTHIDGAGNVVESLLCPQDAAILADVFMRHMFCNQGFTEQVVDYFAAYTNNDAGHIETAMATDHQVKREAARRFAESFTQDEYVAWTSNMEIQ